MTRCVPAALMLLLVAGPAARAELSYHSGSTVYGCVDPQVTVGLSGRDGLLHQDGWAAAQRRRGRCFTLTPRLRLEVISRHGRMALVRRVPPLAGEPPVSVMVQDLRVLAAPAVAADKVGVIVAGTRPAVSSSAREAVMQPVAMPVVAARPAVDADGLPAAGSSGAQSRGSMVARASEEDGSAAATPVEAAAPAAQASPAAGPDAAVARPVAAAGASAVPEVAAGRGIPVAPVVPDARSTQAVAQPEAGAMVGSAAGSAPAAVQTAPVGAAVPVVVATANRVPVSGTSPLAPPAASGAPGMPAGPDGAAGRPAVGTGQGSNAVDTGTTAAPVQPVARAVFRDPDAGRDAARVVPPAPPAVWPPPAMRVAPVSGRGPLISALVTLLLLPFIIGAFMVSRRRRQFSHVEDGLLPRHQPRTASLPTPGGAVILASRQEFRQDCAEALQEAGWETRLTFPADGGGPDIIGRRGDSVIAVRCRVSRTAITGEMVDEAAAMGARQAGSMTVLASNAPFSQRARDEAFRQRVHLLRDTELATFVE